MLKPDIKEKWIQELESADSMSKVVACFVE